jgi:hypothetical protein
MSPRIQILLCSTMIFTLGIWVGYREGKHRADRWYAQNPIMILAVPDRLILQHNEVLCPQGDTCQWQAIDLSTGKRVAP